jgi:tetratricopeptide (TPR) repeat protein
VFRHLCGAPNPATYWANRIAEEYPEGMPMTVNQQEFERLMSRAIAAFNGGRTDVAMGICKAILEHNPHSPPVHQLLAVIYLGQQQVAAACHHIDCSLQARPDHIPSLIIAGRAARANQSLEAAIGFFGRAAALAPNEPEPTYLRGLVLLEQGKLDAAADVFDRLVKLHPLHAAAWCSLGSALQQSGLVKKARSALERSVEVDPGRADAWFNLGLVQQDAGDFLLAVAAFRAALRLQPGYAEAAVNLGIVLQETGDIKEAMDAYRRAFQLRADTFGRIANALASRRCGKIWLDLNELRQLLTV